MHAIEVLREDHKRIETLLDEFEGAGSGAGQRLLERLKRELTVHTLAEDNIFLPQVADAVEDSRDSGDGSLDEEASDKAVELISASHENHRELRDLVETIHGQEVGVARLREIGSLVSLQIETEEQLFPLAEAVLEVEDFERIGDLIEHCKWQIRGLAQSRLASSSSFRPAEALQHN